MGDGIVANEDLATVTDSVTITRKEYDDLLRLTTPQPIETAPKYHEWILVFLDENEWLEASWSGAFWMDSYHRIVNPTHWLPRPNMPKGDNHG